MMPLRTQPGALFRLGVMILATTNGAVLVLLVSGTTGEEKVGPHAARCMDLDRGSPSEVPGAW